MLSYTELKKGLVIALDGQPYEVLAADFLRMQQRKAVVQTKLKNLLNGKLIDRNFQPSDTLEEADVEKNRAKFLYRHRGKFWFSDVNNPSMRFTLDENVIGSGALFLKPDTVVETILFHGDVINVVLPIKMDLKVVESPPAVRGNTAQGGTKQVVLETGAKVNVPLFINEGDTVRVNTETGEYAERVSKN